MTNRACRGRRLFELDSDDMMSIQKMWEVEMDKHCLWGDFYCDTIVNCLTVLADADSTVGSDAVPPLWSVGDNGC